MDAQCCKVPDVPVIPEANILTPNRFLRNVYCGLNHEYFKFEPCCPIEISPLSCVGLFLLDKEASAPNLSGSLWIKDLRSEVPGQAKWTESPVGAPFCAWPSTNPHLPLGAAATGTAATVQEEGNKIGTSAPGGERGEDPKEQLLWRNIPERPTQGLLSWDCCHLCPHKAGP